MSATAANILGNRIGNKACVVLDDYLLKIGCDFSDAITGERRSHGTIGVRKGKRGAETRTAWISSLDCGNSELALRAAAASEGLTVSYLLSQAEG